MHVSQRFFSPGSATCSPLHCRLEGMLAFWFIYLLNFVSCVDLKGKDVFLVSQTHFSLWSNTPKSNSTRLCSTIACQNAIAEKSSVKTRSVVLGPYGQATKTCTSRSRKKRFFLISMNKTLPWKFLEEMRILEDKMRHFVQAREISDNSQS